MIIGSYTSVTVTLALVLIIQTAFRVRSATVELSVFYPENKVSSLDGNVFNYAFSTSKYTYELYEYLQKHNPRQVFAPWFGNYSYLIKDSDRVSANYWRKRIDVG